MSIGVGNTYSLRFKNEFGDLDGIYTITHSLSYDSILEGDIDLLEFLYRWVNKSQSDLDNDLDDLKSETFFRAIHVETFTELYVPRSFIVGIPNPDVREYSKLMITMNLGLFADPNLLSTVAAAVKQNVINLVGLPVDADPVIMEYGKTWMTGTKYDDLTALRTVNKGNAVNYFALAQQRQETINKQASQIAALEELVRQLNDQP